MRVQTRTASWKVGRWIEPSTAAGSCIWLQPRSRCRAYGRNAERLVQAGQRRDGIAARGHELVDTGRLERSFLVLWPAREKDLPCARLLQHAGRGLAQLAIDFVAGADAGDCRAAIGEGFAGVGGVVQRLAGDGLDAARGKEIPDPGRPRAVHREITKASEEYARLFAGSRLVSVGSVAKALERLREPLRLQRAHREASRHDRLDRRERLELHGIVGQPGEGRHAGQLHAAVRRCRRRARRQPARSHPG